MAHKACNMQQLVEHHAESAPHDIAIIHGHSSFTYGELNQKANQLAQYLRQFNTQPDTLIAVSMERSPQLIITLLGIMKAGCGYLPLDAEHPQERLVHMLTETNTPILITQETYQAKFRAFSGHILLYDQAWEEMAAEPVQNSDIAVNANNLVYAIYTSGSTGTPKGVLIEHQSVVNYSHWFQHYSACQPQDRIDFSSPVLFDMAVTTTIAALAAGLQIVICPDAVKKDVLQYLHHLQKNKINLIKLTPSYFKYLTETAKKTAVALPHLHTLILGGEKLLTKDCRDWLSLYPTQVLFNEYGPTETTVAVTAYKVTHANILTLGEVVPIGKPDAEFNIDCQLSDGATGELFIGGRCLARGYLNRAELTAKQFINIPDKAPGKMYKSGDWCRYLPDGNIELIKRIDEQIKIRGYRVEPAEIEACLNAHAQVKSAVVITRDNAVGEKQLLAYCIPRQTNAAELRAYLEKKLPDYMIPAAILMMNEFPLTENGKLDKNALPNPAAEEECIAAQNPLEQQLIAIWQKIFRINKIGRQSNFFALGGHSLIAARIMMEIANVLGKKIEPVDFYKAPTINELAAVITTAPNWENSENSDTFLFNKTTFIPLSDFQFLFWISRLFEPKVKKLNIVFRRRLQGKLDITALNLALKHVLKIHEVLTHRILKFFPAQSVMEDAPTHIQEIDLTTATEMEMEARLSASMDDLVNHTEWADKSPMITLKLFRLKQDYSELQVCVHHYLFDDLSENVFFAELSSAYLHYTQMHC